MIQTIGFSSFTPLRTATSVQDVQSVENPQNLIVSAGSAESDKSRADVDNPSIFDKVRIIANNDTTGKAVRIADIDISKLHDSETDKNILTSYITAVDDALQELTLSASIVGSAKSRMEGNSILAIAPQTQEQLASQSVGIAYGTQLIDRLA